MSMAFFVQVVRSWFKSPTNRLKQELGAEVEMARLKLQAKMAIEREIALEQFKLEQFKQDLQFELEKRRSAHEFAMKVCDGQNKH